MDVEEVTKLMANQQIRRVPVLKTISLWNAFFRRHSCRYKVEMEASEALCEISKPAKLPECNICSIKGIRYLR